MSLPTPAYRISPLASHDIDAILDRSLIEFVEDACRRYALLLQQAIVDVASDPSRPGTHSLSKLEPMLRMYHIGHSRWRAGVRVRNPCHRVVYKMIEPGLIEIVRVLQDGMEPHRHVG